MAKKRGRERKALVALLDQHDPHGFGRWMVRHVEWMRVRNYSEVTVQKREPTLVAFAQWCEARNISRPREVTKPILERYRTHLYYHRKSNGRPLAFGTQQTMLVPLKAFFAWMTRENALLWNPASELDLPKAEKRLPRALTVDEVERVLSQPELGDAVGVRDRAILETLYSTAMRRTELTGLRLSDIDDRGGTVFIRQGKGKRDRVVPIGERAIRWIDKYVDEVRSALVLEHREEILFLTATGEPFVPRDLTKRVGDYVRSANVGKSGACHLLRHSAATLMLEGGADIRHIQEMLGHESLSTTEIYTHVSIRKLKEVHEATHPASKKPVGASPVSDETTTPSTVAATPSPRDELLFSLAAEAAEEAEDTGDRD